MADSIEISYKLPEGKENIRYTAPDGYSGLINLRILGESYNKSNGDVVKPNLNLHARGFAPYGVEIINLAREYVISGLPEYPE